MLTLSVDYNNINLRGRIRAVTEEDDPSLVGQRVLTFDGEGLSCEGVVVEMRPAFVEPYGVATVELDKTTLVDEA